MSPARGPATSLPRSAGSARVHLDTYARIHQVICQIPLGRVSTYGRIAAIVGNCTPRMVGYALAALPAHSEVPWQRVVNAQGKISLRADSGDNNRQRALLEAEGIQFSSESRIDLSYFLWQGPSIEWRLAHGFAPNTDWRGK